MAGAGEDGVLVRERGGRVGQQQAPAVLGYVVRVQSRVLLVFIRLTVGQ